MTKRELKAAETVPNIRLAHLAQVSADVEKSVDFYGKLLGTHANFHSDVGAGISFDDEHHRIALASAEFIPPAPDGSAPPKVQHVAYKLDNLHDLLSHYLRLKEQGMPSLYCIHHTVTMSFYWKDPDGLDIELFIDCLSPEKSIEQMNSDQLEENPIGNPFNPDELVQRYRDGEPMEALLAPPEFDPTLLGPILEAAGVDASVMQS